MHLQATICRQAIPVTDKPGYPSHLGNQKLLLGFLATLDSRSDKHARFTGPQVDSFILYRIVSYRRGLILHNVSPVWKRRRHSHSPALRFGFKLKYVPSFINHKGRAPMMTRDRVETSFANTQSPRAQEPKTCCKVFLRLVSSSSRVSICILLPRINAACGE